MRQFNALFIIVFLFIFGLSACSTNSGRSGVAVNNTNIFDGDDAESPPVASSDDDAGVIEPDVFVETDSGNTEIDVEEDVRVDVVEDVAVDVVEDVTPDAVENDTLQDDVEEDAEADVVEVDADIEPDANTEPDAEEDVSDFCLSNERRLRDLDGDGYGDPNNAILIGVCEPWEDGFVIWQEGQDDCNDGNASVHPEAAEVCGDDIDQDCDGVDEVCSNIGPDLLINLSENTPEGRILLGETNSNVVGIYDATAVGSDFSVDQLTFQLFADVGGTTEQAPPSAVVGVQLVVDGTVWMTSTVGGDGSVHFYELDYVLLDGESTQFKIEIDLGRVPEDVASGDLIGFYLSGFSRTDLESGYVQTEEWFLSDDNFGGTFTIRKTKPTFYLASGSPLGSTIPSYGEVLRFNVAADARGFVGLEEVVFQVTSSDNAESGWNSCESFGTDLNWHLVDITDPSLNLEQGFAFYSALGEPCYDHPNDPLGFVVMSLSEEISAGETKTYSLRADTYGASSVFNDLLRTDITRGADNALGRDILWSDDNYADGIDGELIRNLPVVGGTLVF